MILDSPSPRTGTAAFEALPPSTERPPLRSIAGGPPPAACARHGAARRRLLSPAPVSYKCAARFRASPRVRAASVPCTRRRALARPPRARIAWLVGWLGMALSQTTEWLDHIDASDAEAMAQQEHGAFWNYQEPSAQASWPDYSAHFRDTPSAAAAELRPEGDAGRGGEPKPPLRRKMGRAPAAAQRALAELLVREQRWGQAQQLLLDLVRRSAQDVDDDTEDERAANFFHLGVCYEKVQVRVSTARPRRRPDATLTASRAPMMHPVGPRAGGANRPNLQSAMRNLMLLYARMGTPPTAPVAAEAWLGGGPHTSPANLLLPLTCGPRRDGAGGRGAGRTPDTVLPGGLQRLLRRGRPQHAGRPPDGRHRAPRSPGAPDRPDSESPPPRLRRPRARTTSGPSPSTRATRPPTPTTVRPAPPARPPMPACLPAGRLPCRGPRPRARLPAAGWLLARSLARSPPLKRVRRARRPVPPRAGAHAGQPRGTPRARAPRVRCWPPSTDLTCPAPGRARRSRRSGASPTSPPASGRTRCSGHPISFPTSRPRRGTIRRASRSAKPWRRPTR
eukprot:scaffold1516_cov266-Prasinococcus_capsulatus_cf.AAC.4